MEIKFTKENLAKLKEIQTHYLDKQSSVMAALWLAQEQFGWISTDTMKYIGELLEIPYELIYGVAHFYTMYNKQPVGKYHLQVCTNISCMLRGGYSVLDQICSDLGIKPGETTKDGQFTVSEAECLGSCGTAPMMQVNNYYEENLNSKKLDELLESYKTK